MTMRPYLVFVHRDALFAVEASVTGEIVHMPELAPIEEAPAHIAGVFNLRSKIIPVINLDIHFGHAPRSPKLTDKALVLSYGEGVAGLIVDDALDIWEMNPPTADSAHRSRDDRRHPHFVEGETEHEGRIVMILNHTTLIKSAEPVEEIHQQGDSVTERHSLFESVAAADMAVFRERALNLARQAEETQAVTRAVTVARLGGELFGFDAGSVREITRAHEVSLIPCCPSHIVGVMNLRGGLITIVDIRGALGLPVNGGALKEIVVIEAEGVVAGVAVEEALDVLWIGPQDVSPPPSALHGGAESYVTGVVSMKDGVVTLVDVARILAGGELTVDEEA